ncbi:MAG: DNA translocase FtsK [Muribaculaceae bacterium]|nr:DNA translocase FtsK [Muribaculaceae bacterium]
MNDTEREHHTSSGKRSRTNASTKEQIEIQNKIEHKVRLSSIFTAVTGRRLSIFFGVILILVAAYLLIISISYYFHGAEDQSIVSNVGAIERVIDGGHDEVQNTGHFVGAWLADKLLSQWLGIGSFILIFYVAAVGLSLVRVRPFKFWNLTSRCFLTAIAVSIILGLFSVSLSESVGTHIYPGGLHGHELNRMIVDLAGWWGAIGVSVLMATIVILLFLTDIKAAYRVYVSRMDEHRKRMAERRAEQERLEAIENERKETERKAREAQRKAREAEENAKREAEEQARIASINAANEARTTETDLFDIDDEPVEENDVTKQTRQMHENDTSDDSIFDIPADDNLNNADTDEVEFTITQGEVDQAEEINRNPDEYDPTADLSNFKFPPLDLLKEYEVSGNSVDEAEQEENKERITKTLNDYKIAISSIKATVGPTVTLYEIVPAEGIRISQIKKLEDDIALSLSALGIRIIAPIPGRGTIGIEVPNRDPQTVSMRSIIGSKAFQDCHYELPMAMGRTISNDVFIADLAKIPHLLVAGATGTGKSVGLNDIIASLLYKKHPSQLKFVMIDPKMVEFSLYRKIEYHYLAKLPDEDKAVITDVHKATATLNSLCVEMDNRYILLEDANQRNIKDYNEKFVQRKLNPAKGHRYLPYIVVIVDEFADLIMQVGKEIETPIARIAQKARAVGIHMILATQRPSTNVITGVIKANFPGRVAFRVFQMVDSRTILDRPGANQLIGRGDMLFSTGGRMERVQAAFIDTPEVEAICNAIEEQAGYPTAYELPEYVPEESEGGPVASASAGDVDPLFEEIARLVATTNQASASWIQRRYSIGYNRAGRIMDQLEAAGIVGPSQGGKPRQVLVDAVQIERILGSSVSD